MRKALVLIDFQKEWIDKNSEDFVGDISMEIEKTNQLINFARKNDYKIIFTAHIEKDSDNAFAKGSKSAEIMDEISKENADIIIEKNKISPFYRTSMEAELKDIKEVVVCGILTNMCVRSFVHDAYDRDFDIKVIKDCCIAFDNETQTFTFNDLKATREEIEFLNLDEFSC